MSCYPLLHLLSQNCCQTPTCSLVEACNLTIPCLMDKKGAATMCLMDKLIIPYPVLIYRCHVVNQSPIKEMAPKRVEGFQMEFATLEKEHSGQLKIYTRK